MIFAGSWLLFAFVCIVLPLLSLADDPISSSVEGQNKESTPEVSASASRESSGLSLQPRGDDDDEYGGEYEEYEEREYDGDPVYYYEGGEGEEGGDYEERSYHDDGEESEYEEEYPEAQERSLIVDEEGRAPQFQQLRAEAPPPPQLTPMEMKKPPPLAKVTASAAEEKARIIAAMAPVPKDDPTLKAVFPGRLAL